MTHAGHQPDGSPPGWLPPAPTLPPAGGLHHPDAMHGGYHGPPPTGEPGYPAQGHPAYGYPGPSHASSAYPAQNQPAPMYPYPYPPAYGYGYGYGYGPIAVPRPGPATGAAVLGFINAGLLILGGVLLLFGATIFSEVESATDSGTHYGAELTLDGLANLIAGGLLITGGVLLTGRSASGRILYGVAAGIVLAAGIYWPLRFTDDAGLLVYDALFVGLAAIGVALSWTTDVTRWLRKLPGDNRV